MKSFLNEGEVEQHTLEWFNNIGYEVIFREQTSVDKDPFERKDNTGVVLLERLKRKVDSLKAIAVMLTDQIHKNTNIDWNVRESERAEIRLLVKKILNRYGYPPDMQDVAIKLVVE